ncbi:metallophosphatase domain-containing protein [Shewanella sp. 10N.286.51.B2]|uniref:metallophosphatase domain-containing protein n=1 Tax=Shewanella sp. 10N.286.51.B2 TaxID=3229707 RepID=UPI00354C1C8E
MNDELTCVVISDTHGMYRQIEVPDADVFIHAGDITKSGKLEELNDFNAWLTELPHRYRIVIAGNHDRVFESNPIQARAAMTNAVYLEDEEVTICGIKFYGSPWQPWFLNWAFNLQRGAEIQQKWDRIPDDTDVLITHGPAYRHLDENLEGKHVGCNDLLSAVQRVKPQFHVCGHIHEGYGRESDGITTFINASSCTRRYIPSNAPMLFVVKILNLQV